MYNFTKSLCFLLLLFVAGCKDDKEPEPRNALMHDGREFELTNGLLIDYGKYRDGGNAQVLFLSSSGVQVRETGGNIDSVYGIGHAIYFELVSATENAIGEGEYAFDGSNTGTFKVKTYVYSYAVFNGDFAQEDGEFYELKEGKLTVKKEGTNYIFNIDCLDRNEKHVTAYFKGPLKFYSDK